MNIVKAYKNGFQLAVRSPRMIFTVYFTNFLLVAIFALSFKSLLSGIIGNSMIFDDFLKNGYNLLITDLSDNSGGVLLGIISQLKWGLIAYWLINVFLVGGVIRIFNKQKYNLNQFFSGAGYNFGRFFGLSFLMILAHIILLALVIVGGVFVIKSSYESAPSERILILQGLAFLALYFVLAIILFMASDFGKFYLLLNDSKNFLKAFFKGFGYTFKHLFKSYTLYLSLLIIPVLFFYLFIKVNNDIGMNTIVGIIIMFAIQQVFIYIRFGFRIWILASLFETYSDDFLKDKKIALEKERLLELEEQQTELRKLELEKNQKETNTEEQEKKSEETNLPKSENNSEEEKV